MNFRDWSLGAWCALALIPIPVNAGTIALGDPVLPCIALAADVKAASDAGNVETETYRKLAQLFLATATGLFGEPPVDLDATAAVVTFVITDYPTHPAQIRFYDGSDCMIWAATTQTAAIAEIVRRMAVTI